MRLGYFTMPVHPIDRTWSETLKEDREAIILADRIGIMRAGPGSAVKEEIDVTLARPRNRGSAEFAALYDRIHRVLSEEVQKVLRREEAA